MSDGAAVQKKSKTNLKTKISTLLAHTVPRGAKMSKNQDQTGDPSKL